MAGENPPTGFHFYECSIGTYHPAIIPYFLHYHTYSVFTTLRLTSILATLLVHSKMQLTMIQTPISSAGSQSTGSNMDIILGTIWNDPNAPLKGFFEMWYNVFLWAMFSSIFIHSVAAIIAFLTLRKHAVGRFYSIIILLMGVITPLTTGAVTSAVVSFVYVNCDVDMAKWHVALWGVGQTFCGACFGFTRILAVL